MNDLEKCQELIALLRMAMMATIPALRAGADLNEVESLLWKAGQGEPLGDPQKAAVRRLEQLAGYVASPDSDGECYP